MAKAKPIENLARKQELLASIQALEGEAHLAGMLVTAHALNCAKNALGWEMAGEIGEARNAAKGRDIGSRMTP